MGAIDGVDFKMKNPGVAVDNPARYRVARKNAYELLCLAICDAHLRFTYFDISHEPQVSHDDPLQQPSTPSINGPVTAYSFTQCSAPFIHHSIFLTLA